MWRRSLAVLPMLARPLSVWLGIPLALTRLQVLECCAALISRDRPCICTVLESPEGFLVDVQCTSPGPRDIVSLVGMKLLFLSVFTLASYCSIQCHLHCPPPHPPIYWWLSHLVTLDCSVYLLWGGLSGASCDPWRLCGVLPARYLADTPFVVLILSSKPGNVIGRHTCPKYRSATVCH